MNEKQLYQNYLHQLYHFHVDIGANSEDDYGSNLVCDTYGELLFASVSKLIQIIKPSADDMFLDMGSGIGKLATQVFLQTEITRVLGIEAAKSRNDVAIEACLKLKSQLPQLFAQKRELVFENGNFLNYDLLEVTIIYICSTCFTQELLLEIGKKINMLPNVTKVLTLKPIANLNLPFCKAIEVECSWDSALCYWYKL